MRAKFRFIAVPVVILAVVALAWFFASPNEPSYQGKSLSIWLTNYALRFDGDVKREVEEADDAVRHMGTNSLPILLKMLDAEDPKIKQALNGLMQNRSPIHVDFGSAEGGRWKAVQAFRALGPIAKPAMPALGEMLGRGNTQAAQALGFIGPEAIGTLTNALVNSNAAVRMIAVQTLGGLVSATNTDTGVAALIAPALVRCGRDVDDTVRQAAYQVVVVRFNQLSRITVPLLIELMSDKEPTARSFATGALCSFAARANEAKAALQVALRDPDKEVKRGAILALAYIGTEDTSVRPAVLECLRDPDTDIRLSTAMYLGFPESFGKHAVPELVQLLGDKDRNMRTQAAKSLAQIESKDAAVVLAPLTQNLHDQYSEPRASAATALGSMGAAASNSVPEISKLLKDDIGQVRIAAGAALVRISPGNPEGLSVLVRTLSDFNEDIAMLASATLAQLGPLAKPAIPELVKIIQGQDRAVVRFMATQAVVRLDPENPAGVPLLLKKLEDTDPTVRSDAARFLGGMEGVTSDAIVAALEKALKDPVEDVREMARAALKNVEPGRRD